MPCITVEKPAPPNLPSPLVLPKPGFPIPGLPKLCCKLPPLPEPKIPISLPPGILNPALIAALKKYNALRRAYLDQRPLNCPKE